MNTRFYRQLHFTDLANFFVPRPLLERGVLKHMEELGKTIKKNSKSR